MSKAPWLILGLGRDGFAPGECSDLIPGEPHQVTAGRRKKLPMNHRNPFSSATLVTGHSIGRFLERRDFLPIVLALVCCSVSPAARAQLPSPSPDGGYPNQNTAEGEGALQNVSPFAERNTAVGFEALLGNVFGRFNTATGAFALSNNNGTGNTAIGDSALKDNTTGVVNTATGFFALANNTKGSFNTATGDSALTSNKTGNDNTATGDGALSSNTTGRANTATGSLALVNNTTADNNTATGFGALVNNTASNNTATGADALSHNRNGTANTANGYDALLANWSGSFNTADGAQALFNNTTGQRNTAVGFNALFNNSVGSGNTATGYQALQNNSGDGNTATGVNALLLNQGKTNTANGAHSLESNQSGNQNVAVGGFALSQNTVGSSNIAVGFNSGSNLTTGSNNISIGALGMGDESRVIRIGTPGKQNATFIAGIYNASEGGIVKTVYINNNGQLGTQPPASSRRFKEEIRPMDQTSEAILDLKPVTFQYKDDRTGIPQFGLIAEEVAKVNPDLVVRDENGQIYTVRYEAVNAMLLNEFLKAHRKLEEQQTTIEQQQIEALTATVQKVSDQVALSKPPTTAGR